MSRLRFFQSQVAEMRVKLPAKKLPVYDLPRFVVLSTLFGGFAIVGPCLLLYYLHYLIPDTHIPFLDSSTQAASCDLIQYTGSLIEEAFTINLRSSLRLSFAGAKGIDTVWDLIIGQGGRLLLAWIAFKVFMDGLARLMEASAVSYDVYISMVFEVASIRSVWQSLVAIREHRWRGREFLAWFCFATAYVLGFPTLMSAATGYINPSSSGYRMPDQSSSRWTRMS